MDNATRTIIEIRKSIADMGLKLSTISHQMRELNRSGEFDEMPQGYYEELKAELNKAREALNNLYSNI